MSDTASDRGKRSLKTEKISPFKISCSPTRIPTFR